MTGAAAGLHVVLRLPSRELESAVRRLVRSRGVLVDSLSQHALPGYQGPAGLLVGYGAVPEPTIPLAVEQIAQALRDAMSTRPELWGRPWDARAVA